MRCYRARSPSPGSPAKDHDAAGIQGSGATTMAHQAITSTKRGYVERPLWRIAPIPTAATTQKPLTGMAVAPTTPVAIKTRPAAR